ncbi:hypothetical protein GJ496_007410 [Pomphorhynchus laevis]|nr:hypothetical protein GJ496_007410 [Pomphorhynchus laevis]
MFHRTTYQTYTRCYLTSRFYRLYARNDYRGIKSSAILRVRKLHKNSNHSPQNQTPSFFRWLGFTVSGFLLYNLLTNTQRRSINFLSWNEFLNEMLSKGEVKSIIIRPDNDIAMILLHDDAIIKGEKITNPVRFMDVDSTQRFEEKIRKAEQKLGIQAENNIPITYQRSNPLFALAVFSGICLGLYSLFRNMRISFTIPQRFNGIRNLSKANFREFDSRVGRHTNIAFKNVAGLKEAKIELNEFVSYLNSPARYKELGAKLPRGALLVGPPGCGKTLLAKALSSEAQVPFLSMAGSEFIEVVGGVGAARVRDLFKEARKRSPCIIYIDELDAIGKKRSADTGHSSGEHEQTLNQLLVDMDGLESAKNTVILIASTNRPDVLDRALLRPGRFDRHILIDLPNKAERKEILELHLSSIKLDSNDNLNEIADELSSETVGMSGADLSNVCNEAALYAALQNMPTVTRNDFRHAMDKIQYGIAKKSTTMSQSEKRLQALRESGHLIVAWNINKCKTMKKVSIIERIGNKVSLGPKFIQTDSYIISQKELLDQMTIQLGGRAAECSIMHSLSSGSESDLKDVTKCAYDQVRHYGMSKRLGPIAFEANDLLGSGKPYSRKMQSIIDSESNRLVAETYRRAESIVCQNKDLVVKLAGMIYKLETLNVCDVKNMLINSKGTCS